MGRRFVQLFLVAFLFMSYCNFSLARTCKDIFNHHNARVFGLNSHNTGRPHTDFSFHWTVSRAERATVELLMAELETVLPPSFVPRNIEVLKGDPREDYAIPDMGVLVIGRELYEYDVQLRNGRELFLSRDDSNYKKVVTHEISHVVLEKAWIKIRNNIGMRPPEAKFMNQLVSAVHELFADFVPDLIRGSNAIADVVSDPYRQFLNYNREWPGRYFYPRRVSDRSGYNVTLPARIYIHKYVLEPVREGRMTKSEAMESVLLALIAMANKTYEVGVERTILDDSKLNEFNKSLIQEIRSRLPTGNEAPARPFVPPPSPSSSQPRYF